LDEHLVLQLFEESQKALCKLNIIKALYALELLTKLLLRLRIALL
jgi:hypothetical protein